MPPKAADWGYIDLRDSATITSGQSVLQSENGSLYEVFPDGRKVLLKRLEPQTPVIPGTTIKIR